MKSLKVLLSFILRVLCSGMGGRAGQGARGLASAARDATQSMARNSHGSVAKSHKILFSGMSHDLVSPPIAFSEIHVGCPRRHRARGNG